MWTIQKFLDEQFGNFTQEDADRIRVCPQHLEDGITTNPEWLVYRKYRITGSDYAAAAGLNKYTTPSDLVYEKMHGTFTGNDATRYGSLHEPDAQDVYVDYKINQLIQSNQPCDFKVENPGLCVNPKHPWIGMSPDGIIYENGKKGLLEIKCPYSKRMRRKNGGDFYPVIQMTGFERGHRAPVPKYYQPQLQGGMGLLGLDFADFVVWTPEETQITRIPFNKNYFTNDLFPKLHDWYHTQYAPAVVDELNSGPPIEIDFN